MAALLSPSGLGMGDVKLAFVLGLFLGETRRSSRSSPGLVLVVASAIPAVARPAAARRARKMHLALGPFLALGGMLALLAGEGEEV